VIEQDGRYPPSVLQYTVWPDRNQHGRDPELLKTPMYFCGLLTLAEIHAVLLRAPVSVAFTQEPTSGARLQVAMRLVEEQGAAVTDAPLAYVIAALPTLTAWSAQVTDEPHAPWLSNISPVDKTTDPHTPEAIFFELAQLEAEGSLYPNLSDVASTLKHLPSQRLHAALPLLLEAMKTLERTCAPSFFVLEKIAKAFLHIAFGDVSSTEAQQRTAEQFTQEQRQALEAIVGSDTLWRHQGNMRSLLSPLGVPTERETLRAFMSGESA
jgi:hypothetical protein